MNFRRSITIADLWQPEVAKLAKILRIFAFFGKTIPYGKIFKNSVLNVFIATPIDVLCSNFVKSNFVKFGRREIGKVVHYLRDKKVFACLSLLRRSSGVNLFQNLGGHQGEARRAELRVEAHRSESGGGFLGNFWLQVTYPLLKAASFDTFCLVAPQP